MVKLFLEAGENVTEKDNDGLTALSWSEKGSHKEIVRLLEEARAKE